VILSAFLLEDSVKFWFASIVLLITGRVQLHLKPYKKEDNNQAEFLAIVAGFVTVLSGMIFQEEDQVGSLNTIIYILAISLNTLFVLKWISMVLKMFEEKSNAIRKVI